VAKRRDAEFYETKSNGSITGASVITLDDTVQGHIRTTQRTDAPDYNGT
jgi:hypothetical protein